MEPEPSRRSARNSFTSPPFLHLVVTECRKSDGVIMGWPTEMKEDRDRALGRPPYIVTCPGVLAPPPDADEL